MDANFNVDPSMMIKKNQIIDTWQVLNVKLCLCAAETVLGRTKCICSSEPRQKLKVVDAPLRNTLDVCIRS